MNRLLFLLLLSAVFATGSIQAQNPGDSITIRSGFTTRFVQHDTLHSRAETLEIMRAVPDAYYKMRTSLITGNIAVTGRFIGGVLIFIQLANKFERRQTNWKPAIFGLGIFFASLPFAGLSSATAEEAVDIYNSNLKSSGWIRTSYEFGITDNGVGVRIRF